MRVAINGFGRIGRLFLRIAMKRGKVNVVAINSLEDIKTCAHLFKYDTAYGRYEGEVYVEDSCLVVDGKRIKCFSENSPERIPWGSEGVDIVIESTGAFRSKEGAMGHIKAGAGLVIISAPPKDPSIKTVVMGVNHTTIAPQDTIISNASCTTNCAAPMIKVLHENFGVRECFLTTVHAYTNSQRLQDAIHKDLREARAAAQNIIPAETGASKAVELVLPELKGRIKGSALRVPVITGSLTELYVVLERPATREEINNAFKKASETTLKGIMAYTEDPIVSSDIIGDPHSVIVDGGLTTAGGVIAKVSGWYDNEYGYASRLVDLVEYVMTRVGKSSTVKAG